jgi:hypothetical protein
LEVIDGTTGEVCTARITARTVEIFLRGKCIASHLALPHRPMTIPEHMPSSHRRDRDWTHERIRPEAAKMGPDAETLIDVILRSRPHPERGFPSAIGILGLVKRYGQERVDAACARALLLNARSYQSIAAILKNGTHVAHSRGAHPLPRQHPRPRLLQLIRRSPCSSTPLSSVCAHSASLPWQIPSSSRAIPTPPRCRTPIGSGLLVDREVTTRDNRRLVRRLANAKLRQAGTNENVDYRSARGLDHSLFQNLGTGQWIHDCNHLVIVGPTGTGKSWLACALGNKACRDGFSVLYIARSPFSLRRAAKAVSLTHRRAGYVNLLILDWGPERNGRSFHTHRPADNVRINQLPIHRQASAIGLDHPLQRSSHAQGSRTIRLASSLKLAGACDLVGSFAATPPSSGWFK